MSMTVEEAKGIIVDTVESEMAKYYESAEAYKELRESLEIVLESLKEHQQYRAIIGLTPEDLKALEKDEIQTIRDALKAFAEWSQYKEIGTVSELWELERCMKVTTQNFEEAMKDIKILENINSQLTEYLRKYQDIGTLEELRKLKEKRISKEVNGFTVCGCTMEEYDAVIREKAIEEFAKAMKGEYPFYSNDFGLGINGGLHRSIDKIAKELKGE